MNSANSRTLRFIMQKDENTGIAALDDPDISIGEWKRRCFAPLEHSAVDAIAWDIGLESEACRVYRKGPLPFRAHPVVERWAAQGFDWLEECVAETHRAGMEAFWNHRISEVDLPHPLGHSCPHNDPCRKNELKQAHPDWLIPCWWPQGLWNLANPELRVHKVAMLRNLMRNYPLDGLQLDFARHTPCLPPGREWECRDGATEFVRQVRRMLQEVGARSGRRPLLLARVAETVEGNHLDGLEVEKWIAEGWIDILVPGGRSIAVDIAGYRALPGGEAIRICPSWDGHHTNEGGHRPPSALLRGIFANYLEQGADSISLFNWLEDKPLHRPYREILSEEFSVSGFRRGKEIYMADRRGEYPWAGNYLYRSDDKPLPATVAHGAGTIIPVEIHSDRNMDRLELLIENLKPGDLAEVGFNGAPLAVGSYEPERPDELHGFDPAGTRPKYPGANCRIGLPAKPGANFVSLRFRANANPVLFTVRDLKIHAE